MTTNPIQTLTLGELADIEDEFGISITDLADEEKPKTRALIGMAWAIKRREHPDYTLAEARSLTLAELGKLTGTGAASE